MTIQQQVSKLLYPLIMWLTGLKPASAKIKRNTESKTPVESLYHTSTELINDGSFLMEQLKGKKILLVNTASDCGYTGQYEALEKLNQRYQGKLVILGFPANDFQQQEKGSNAEIAAFCQVNYGVTFPLMKKSQVVKGNGQNPVFNWLSDAGKNGWNNQAPLWNFTKYLVDEKGMLTHYFDSSVSPMSEEVLNAIG